MITTILLFALAFGQTPSKTYTDADIKTCVSTRLADAPSLAGETITITVEHGLVTLTGKISDSRKKATATRIARSKTCGATEADNRLQAAQKIAISKKAGRPEQKQEHKDSDR